MSDTQRRMKSPKGHPTRVDYKAFADTLYSTLNLEDAVRAGGCVTVNWLTLGRVHLNNPKVLERLEELDPGGVERARWPKEITRSTRKYHERTLNIRAFTETYLSTGNEQLAVDALGSNNQSQGIQVVFRQIIRSRGYQVVIEELDPTGERRANLPKLPKYHGHVKSKLDYHAFVESYLTYDNLQLALKAAGSTSSNKTVAYDVIRSDRYHDILDELDPTGERRAKLTPINSVAGRTRPLKGNFIDAPIDKVRPASTFDQRPHSNNIKRRLFSDASHENISESVLQPDGTYSRRYAWEDDIVPFDESSHAKAGIVAERNERLLFWSHLMRDQTMPPAARLKASEYLARTSGDFQDNMNVTNTNVDTIAPRLADARTRLANITHLKDVSNGKPRP